MDIASNLVMPIELFAAMTISAGAKNLTSGTLASNHFGGVLRAAAEIIWSV